MDNETSYDQIKALIRNEPRFRFDWFFRSRTSTELQRRCTQLVNYVEREINGPAANAGDEEKKRKRPPAGNAKNQPAKKKVATAKA